MGFYGPDVVIGDARRHGVPVLPPDVNRSQAACTLEPQPSLNPPAGLDRPSPVTHTTVGPPLSPAVRRPPSLSIRLGLRYVHGLDETRAKEIVACRGERPFASLADLYRRTRLPKALVENLIRAGALDGLAAAPAGQTRRDLLWQLGSLPNNVSDALGLDGSQSNVSDGVDLPPLGELERMLWEYELLGTSPGAHLMDLWRDALAAQGVLSSADLAERRSGEKVRVAGRVIVRQRPPSAKGFVFVTLEDEHGLINLIVRPKTYARFKPVLRASPLLLVEGALQRERGAVNVQLYRASPLFPPLTGQA
jgi:error-prone DNA polymerase